MPPPTPRLEDWLDPHGAHAPPPRGCGGPGRAVGGGPRAAALRDARLGRVVRWRIPGLRTDQTFDALFRAYPFTLLEEGETFSISGLCGRIWTLARDYPAARRPRGLPRLGRARHGARPVRPLGRAGADGGAELFSEARVEPVDRTRARCACARCGR